MLYYQLDCYYFNKETQINTYRATLKEQMNMVAIFIIIIVLLIIGSSSKDDEVKDFSEHQLKGAMNSGGFYRLIMEIIKGLF